MIDNGITKLISLLFCYKKNNSTCLFKSEYSSGIIALINFYLTKNILVIKV